MGLTVFECARKKVIGKPYEGKLHVRFDEGAVGPPLPYSTTPLDRKKKRD